MKTNSRFDVVVVGGGAGGVAAAVGAAKLGASTLLLERYGFLGGAATSSMVLTYCGFVSAGNSPKRVVGGVGQEVLDRLERVGVDVSPKPGMSGYFNIPIEGEATKFVLDEVVADNPITCWLHTSLISASVSGGRIKGITVMDRNGFREIEAAAFVDASGDGVLSHLAGVPADVDATLGAEVQPASYPIRIGGIPGNLEFPQPLRKKLVASIQSEIEGVQLRDNGGPIMRLPISNEIWWMPIDILTDGLTTESLTFAERWGRSLAWRCVTALKKLPGFESAYLVASGPQVGVRESRRPKTRHIVNEADASAGLRSEKTVARAGWPMEVHVRPSGNIFVPIGGEGFFDIPLDAIRPVSIDNLFVAGRLTGSDAHAFGSVRVMGTAFATGQGAGVAAGLIASGDEDVEIAPLRKELLKQGAII